MIEEKSTTRAAFLAAFLAAGCGSGSDDTGGSTTMPGDPASEQSGETTIDNRFIEGFEPLAPRENETQLIIPPISGIEAGADINYCTYLPVTTEENVNVVAAVGEQTLPGHHAILYMASQPQEPGTHECTEADMFNANYVAAVGGGVREEAVIPDGLGYFVPADSQFFVQTHWINFSDAPMDGQAAFNIEMRPVSEDVTSTSMLTIGAMVIDVPPHSNGVARTSCTFDKERAIFAYAGHAHEWGTRVQYSVRRASGESELLYDEPWEPEYSSDSPMQYFSRTEPFVFHAGDTLELECEYENTTDEPLQFPGEMCFMIGYYFPGKEQLFCADGTWLSVEQAAAFTK